MKRTLCGSVGYRRRAAVAVGVAVGGTVLVGFTALAIDVSLLHNVRMEAQRSADSGALAGAYKLLGDDRVRGADGMSTIIAQVREDASSLSESNRVYDGAPQVNLNTGNTAGGDIVLGRLEHPENLSEPLSTQVDATRYNCVRVVVRRDDEHLSPVHLLFAQVFGQTAKDVSASAAAVAEDRVVGYKVTSRTGNAELMPIALHVDAWTALLNGTRTTGDQYSYDPETGTVSPGGDGIPELNLYPGSGTNQLPSGNFGTVDIGNSNNSTADLSRQIRYGVSEADLAYFGGELRFNADGVLLLEGDTGLSAAIKDDLTSIIGRPRAIPIFSQASGPGNNAVYTVVAFAGIRILNVKLTGAMSKKEVIIQPAVVVDDAVLTDSDANSSYFVFRPPVLVR